MCLFCLLQVPSSESESSSDEDDGESSAAGTDEQRQNEPGNPKRRKKKKKRRRRNVSGDLVSHKFIFGVIFSRCRDSSATVRAKALQTLAEITLAQNQTIAQVIQNIFYDIPVSLIPKL